jgi:hypothetical protein
LNRYIVESVRFAIQQFTMQRHNQSRQLCMVPVAERRVLRVLATAPRHGFRFLDFRFQRRETGAFVRAVAKRLAFGFAARAPEISAGFSFLNDGGFLGNDWFTHNVVTIFQFGENANSKGI